MTFTEQYVAMTVAVLNADGKCEASELDTIRTIANDYGLDKKEVEDCINKEFATPKTITQAAKGISKKDAADILDACVAVALADKYINSLEITLLLDIAKSLKLDPAKAVLDIAIFAQNDRDILIEGSATLHGDEELTIENED